MGNNWLTSTVFALCNSMRAQNDYSTLPILADAMEDAGCDDQGILDACRNTQIKLIDAQVLVCTVLGGEYRNSVDWLKAFIDKADCPGFEDTVSAAQGINVRENQREDDFEIHGRVYDMSNYYHIENDGEYLYFGGRDAHSDIPPEFWDHVARVTGKNIPQEKRAQYFSCSC